MADHNPDLVIGEDGRARPRWATSSPLYIDYYDNEWGQPVRDEAGLYERLTLEGFQSGLSWAIVLAKRPAFRAAFSGFDPDAVAAFGDDDVARLMADAGIIRNRRKIEAAIGNARATVRLREQGGLPALVWSFLPERTPAPESLADLRATSPEAMALSKALKRHGFQWVGPTTAYATMQAIGMVDDHLVGSWRRGSSGVFGADGTLNAGWANVGHASPRTSA
ncbi:DNA-3-methyladenine glycosylase I [Brooklawnia cerclae]|uniref:DNA-3-methyladenine glycosylase I n=1 Tax=Brooklawnia cerclae TaxID=349934 RepID=A0ABX0SHK4_9ACTN|nr:DNA-3-methyladenine glycosylase I [Brooklawnia cerclae]NIH57887.1 DNA-3-methyladenine glycosylase I [Brooklawnia cerclae]